MDTQRPELAGTILAWMTGLSVAVVVSLLVVQIGSFTDRQALLPLARQTLKYAAVFLLAGAPLAILFGGPRKAIVVLVSASAAAMTWLLVFAAEDSLLMKAFLAVASGLAGFAVFVLFLFEQFAERERVLASVDRPWKPGLCFLLLSVAAAFLIYHWRLHGIDDALITARYSRNLAQGNGWVYNLGEAVNGTTSATNTLLIAVVSWVTGPDLRIAGAVVYALGMAGVAWFTFLFFRAAGYLFALIAGFMCSYFNIFQFFVGLETSLFLMIALGTIYTYQKRNFPLAAFLAALLVLTRPDGGILTLVLLADFLLRHFKNLKSKKNVILKCMLIYILTLTPWIVFSWLNFGKILPEGVGAKIAQGESGFWGDKWLFVRGIWHYVPGILFRNIPGFTWLTLTAMSVGGVMLSFRLKRENLLIFAWVAAQIIIYSLFNVPSYPWYYIPLYYAVFYYAAVFLFALWQRLADVSRPIIIAGRTIVAAAGIAFAVASFGATDYKYGRPSAPIYIAASNWLMTHGSPGQSVAAIEIGNIGYFAHDKKIIDMGGLVTAGGAEAIARGDFSWWVANGLPDYILIHDPIWPFEKTVVEKPFFKEYRKMVTFKAPDLWPLDIYARK